MGSDREIRGHMRGVCVCLFEEGLRGWSVQTWTCIRSA